MDEYLIFYGFTIKIIQLNYLNSYYTLYKFCKTENELICNTHIFFQLFKHSYASPFITTVAIFANELTESPEKPTFYKPFLLFFSKDTVSGTAKVFRYYFPAHFLVRLFFPPRYGKITNFHR